ncbi:MAG: N-acetyl-gamma-glutamyl-phosphate reductase [Methanomicrobiales archaeon]|jgi:N-acetyl-gamma-glutamyl-phosphate reductase|nr:N-acetyl-gamma-glutamyl-phosphate reductase [Methanomicrobiales archaeon]
MQITIIGASGYAGGELIRLLLAHQHTQINAATSRSLAGKNITSQHPHLMGLTDLRFTNPDISAIDCDIAFLAVPHTQAMEYVSPLLERGIKVIDLSADYRLLKEIYEETYGVVHTAYQEAPYGLCELHRNEIKEASLIANPGCFPTGATLAAAPLAKEASLVIYDSKSGVSGAGDNPSTTTHFPNVSDTLTAYKITTHRHLPEMRQELIKLGSRSACYFTPHLIPANRGILTTAHIILNEPMEQEEVLKRYHEFYKDEYFVRMQRPSLSYVRGSNFCDIMVEVQENRVVAVSAIDNLVKGAAGQAIQNMNIMCGYPEQTGLTQAGMSP